MKNSFRSRFSSFSPRQKQENVPSLGHAENNVTKFPLSVSLSYSEGNGYHTARGNEENLVLLWLVRG